MFRPTALCALSVFALACDPAARSSADAAGLQVTRSPLLVPADGPRTIEIVPMASGALVFQPDCARAGAGADAGEALRACGAPPKAEGQACPAFNAAELKEPALAELASACAFWDANALPAYVMTRETMVAGVDGDPLQSQSFVQGGEVQSASVNGMPVLDGDTVYDLFAQLAPLAAMGLPGIEIRYDEALGFITEVAIRSMDQRSWTVMTVEVVAVWPELDEKEVVY